MTKSRQLPGPGPFRADQVPEGAPYELSNGHAILCLPTGGRGSRATLVGGSVLESDPDVEAAGVDVGYSQSPDSLRAPDLAVGNVPDEPGWVKGVPLLAVEYADSGQDEEELSAKIDELLAGGTRLVWVVRLVGPRRVDVYERGREPRVVDAAGQLEAPGILRNPVSVRALYDREAAHEATLRNLLQRAGYASLEAVQAAGLDAGRKEGLEAGRKEGLRAAIRRAIERKRGAMTTDEVTRMEAEHSLEALEAWLDEALG